MKENIENQLLILNTIMYVNGVFNSEYHEDDSIYDIILNISQNSSDYPVSYSSDVLSPEQWEDVKNTVLDNPDIYDNLTIRSVETKYEARSVTITDDKNNMYVIYQGTGDGREWNDNGVGAHANVTVYSK